MNRVLAHTGATYPIVQAPMGWIARTALASAVSRAGGLGIIETSSGETQNFQAEIEKMRARGLPFGVIGHIHEAKAAGAAGFTVQHHTGAGDRPIGFKLFAQFFVGQAVGQVADI